MLVTELSQLPDPATLHGVPLAFDVETTSFDDEVKALDVYAGHRVAGYGVRTRDGDGSWYLPVRHRPASRLEATQPLNLPLDGALDWLRVLGRDSREWVGHFIAFDAAFARADGIELLGEFVDTVALAHFRDENRYNYQLKQLARDVLEEETSDETRVKEYRRAAKSEDYGVVPPDILGEYCERDCARTWRLREWSEQAIDSTMSKLVQNERRLTRTLFELQWHGVRFDVEAAKPERAKLLRTMIGSSERLHELTGREINPQSPDDKDALVRSLGLGPVAFTEDGNPSYDADALDELHKQTLEEYGPNRGSLVLSELIRYLEASYPLSVLDSWTERAVDGVLHCSYKQNVRTGRTACEKPNMQNVAKSARRWIVPRPGYRFVSCDYSQIEYRLFAHYAKNARVLDEYLRNPDADFHQMLADMLSIARRPAKTINFGCLYGMGFPKFIRSLRALRPELNDEEGERWARRVYHQYHKLLPEVRQLSHSAELTARRRGFVYDVIGRKRRLTDWQCRKALNSVVQGGAADIVKERWNAADDAFRARDWRVVLNVHDELLFEVPDSEPEDLVEREVRAVLEHNTFDLRVPLRINVGQSNVNWQEAAA